MAMEEDFLLDAEDDARAVEYIQNYLPQDLKDKFTEDDLYYILDLIAEYYTSSECLDAAPDEEGYINIDLDEVVDYVVKQAKKEGEMDLITRKMSSSWYKAKWNTEILWKKNK